MTPGQLVAKLAALWPRRDSTTQPFLSLERVDFSAAGYWFMTTGSEAQIFWSVSAVTFDLDGRLVGIVGSQNLDRGLVYTSVLVVESLWEDLIAGKNIDRLRLDADGDEGVSPRADARITLSDEVRKKAMSASVRIREVGSERFPGDADCMINMLSHQIGH